ncbi:replication associated protein [Biomphalaria glabrata]
MQSSIQRTQRLKTLGETYAVLRLKRYQSELIDLCKKEPDTRKIHWFYEERGNVGKTFISKYLVSNYNAIRFENAKSADIKFAYNGEPIVIFDFTRSQQDHINYEIIESIKNGIYFNSKYESGMRIFNSPHVIVFSNEGPDETKMSQDRWDIHYITQHDTEYIDILEEACKELDELVQFFQ